jgi:hypothetical protein
MIVSNDTTSSALIPGTARRGESDNGCWIVGTGDRRWWAALEPPRRSAPMRRVGTRRKTTKRTSRPAASPYLERNPQARNIRMRWGIILVAVLALSSAAAAQAPGRIDNARSLQAVCDPVQRSIEKPKRRSGVPLESGLLCLGYMQAMQDISVLKDADGRSVLGACPSEQTKLGDLIRAFVRYAGAHPAELGESAAVAVIKSFRQTFPCPAAGPPAAQERTDPTGATQETGTQPAIAPSR